MKTRNHTHCTRCSARYDEHTVPARACPDRAGVFAKAEPQRGGASMSFTDAEVQMLARLVDAARIGGSVAPAQRAKLVQSDDFVAVASKVYRMRASSAQKRTQ